MVLFLVYRQPPRSTRTSALFPGTTRVRSHWYGKPGSAMAEDLRAAADRARAANPAVTGVLPVGQAWNRAMTSGVADPNPYDGIAYGQLDLWAYDHYHASVAGTYLLALVTFGAVTGIDPTELGPKEKGAEELGPSDAPAASLPRTTGRPSWRGGGLSATSIRGV